MSAFLIFVGSLITCAGIWLIYPPAAIIAGGLVVSAVGVVWALAGSEE